MANPIGDMVIKVDLDSTGVSKSMTGLRRQLKSVNTEMRANLSSFSRSDKSMAKYSTMMDGLTKRQRIQKGAVEEARKEYDKMADTYGANSAKAQGAAIKLNEQIALYEETGREISNLKTEMENFQKEQDIANSGWTKTGDALTGFGDKLGAISGKMRAVGGTLTKSITLPALGVATALGGITAALGWGRLVGLDSAQAQLKGLGYDTEEVGRISEQVTSAIDGGMTTMAEGTSVAAGAMAAGVKEGKDLERYIKLVGDAAVGSGRPVNDMAQIFNRVQGSGKLMTMELNMIEQGMPGFAQAMAKNLNVSQEKFREMVTNGEVDSAKFMDVMEDFAGGMAGAYADSWQGMVANTKAYIGIIGENLLGGVFEKSKESIAEFIEVLKSDAVADWAEQMGNTIGNAFSNVVDTVKTGITWFKSLDTEHQKLIGKLGLLAVTIGPVLTVLGVFGGFISKISSGLGVLMRGVGKAGGLFRLLGVAFAALTSPIGLIVGAVALLTTGFILLYKKSETFRNFIQNLGATLKQVFFTIMEAIQPMIEKVVSFFQDNIPKLIDGVKNILSSVAEFIKPAIDAIVSFFTGIIATLKEFWDKEGSQIMEAVQVIGNFIISYIQFAFGIWQTVMSSLWTAVKWAFDKILAIIDFIMPAVLFIIEMVWGNIKGVITGVLDVIMGAVKVFSGIFTGDFAKMWEGVKQMFVGAITAVWNYIQLLFVGRILKGIGSFVKLFGSAISGLWTKVIGIFTKSGTAVFNFVKSIFSKILSTIQSILNGTKNFISKIWNTIFNFYKSILTKIFNTVKSIFTKTKNTISSIFTSVKNLISKIWNGIFSFLKKIATNIFNSVKNIFTNLRNTISSIFNAVKSAISKIWNSIFSTIKRLANNIWSSVKNIFSTMRSGVTNLATRTKDGIVGQWNKIKSSVTNLASGMWNSVKKTFDKMVSGAKSLPGKIGSGIRGAKNKAVDGVKSLGNSIVGKFGGVVNGFVKGINNVTGKLGIKKKISKWSVPKFAKGTGGHEGGAMIVGDKYGRELVTMPNGRSFVSPDTDTLLPNMPKGTKVLPNKQTEELLDSPIPMYAEGTGWAAKLKEKISGGLSKAKDWMGNVWDYAKNPSKLVGKIVDKLGLKIDGLSGGAMSMANGGFTYAKDKGKEYLKNMFKKSEDEGGNAPNIKGGASAWRGMISRAAARMNESVTGAQINGIIAQIQRESGGNQKITQSSAVVDVNTLSGNPARGLLQYIPQTFAAYKMKGHNNIYSGYDQLLAFFNNKTWRRDLPYGTRGWGPRGARKYATGGLVKKKQLAMLAEEGHPEMVIPTDPKRRSDAMKLLALTGKMLGIDGDDRGSVRPNSLPSVKGNNGQSKTIQKLEQSVEMLTAMMAQMIADKKNDKPVVIEVPVYMDSKQVGHGVSDVIDNVQTAKIDMQMIMNGIRPSSD